ncbi:MAG TPA: hypothetical protein VMN57_12910 [Anaerolineales bacterium]|nr:hypothetical protein [Anaerolineales bacterium]
MDIFFQDPDDVPVPPEEVRIRDFTATPYHDGRRVSVYLEITPFQKRPSGEITVTNLDGEILAVANIIETMTRKLELTLHLRGPAGGERLQATADIFYQENPSEDDPVEGVDYELPDRVRVDMAQTSFTVPGPDV